MLRSAVAVSKARLPILAVSLFVALASTAQQPAMPRSEKHEFKHEFKHEIDQLEESWRDAELKSNIAAMSALLADDYMSITASGTLQNKDQALASLRAGKTHFVSLDLSDRKVRYYGGTAIVTSIARVKGVSPEGDVAGNFRYTRVYVRDSAGKWKIVSFEASRIRESNEHKDEHK